MRWSLGYAVYLKNCTSGRSKPGKILVSERSRTSGPRKASHLIGSSDVVPRITLLISFTGYQLIREGIPEIYLRVI